MSRAQERSSGPEGGAQAPQRGPSATGADSTAGATGTTGTAATTGATTPVTTGTGATGTTSTGTTGTGVRDRSGSLPEQPSASESYARGTAPAPAPAYRTGEEAESPSGGTVYGGVFLIVTGLLTFFAGLSAINRPHYYHTASNYYYAWNVHSWGWILFGLGIAMFAVGGCALLNMTWARMVGVALCVLTALAGFLWLVYAPVWGVILVALSVVAIWGLIHSSERRASYY
jgi:hypothetical protein